MTEFGQYPSTRLRRPRAHDWSRRMVAEHALSVNDLILPLFIQEGTNTRTPIISLPGVERFSIDLLVDQAKRARDAGIPAIALFPATPPERKSNDAKEAWNKDNLICRATRAIKQQVENLGIICDVALDPYTSHGHDGLLPSEYVGLKTHPRPNTSGEIAAMAIPNYGGHVIDNDSTIEALCKQAVNQARAGCDIIAPSDMMDGRIGKIRKSLDAEGFQHVQILAYAAKYASAFYGPFRDAVGSASNLGKADKRGYQMDPANSKEAIREVALDITEGADMVMVKPGMPYLDIIKTISENFPVPVFAYQVSGEYAMLKAASATQAIDYETAMLESLIAFKRAGAKGIFTYAALEIAENLAQK